jgi:hypothetical protein
MQIPNVYRPWDPPSPKATAGQAVGRISWGLRGKLQKAKTIPKAFGTKSKVQPEDRPMSRVSRVCSRVGHQKRPVFIDLSRVSRVGGRRGG